MEKKALEFKKEDYLKHESLFKELAHAQKPHTLFITCSDSRIIPTLITNTKPGELFVLRNIANIIPPYKVKEHYQSISVIEYALAVIGIKRVIICGHSNCGGCQGVYDEKALEKIPSLKYWLKNMYKVKEKLKNEKNELYKKTEELNIINSYENLLEYPVVKETKPQILLWHYDIGSGVIKNYDFSKASFL